MEFMNELWFAAVPAPSAPTSFFRLLPKASTNLPGAKALDLSGWLMMGLRQTPKRDCVIGFLVLIFPGLILIL